MSQFHPGQSIENLNATGLQEETDISVTLADTGVIDVQTITFGAFATFAQGDFFTCENAAGTVFAVWFDLDANGTEPNGAIYTAADTAIEVDIATGNTATQVATAVQAAITGNITGSTTANPSAGVVTITSDTMGVVGAAVSYLETEADVSAGITPVATATGVASNYLDTEFLVSTPAADFHVWFNVNAEGTDPETTANGLEIEIDPSASAATIISELVTVIGAATGLDCAAHGSGIRITNTATGTAADASVTSAPVTIGQIRQGDADSVLASPSSSPATRTNTPSVV
jgi:hypothetical protein